MTRLLRAMGLALVSMPVGFKILLAAGLATEFIVITQWERLHWPHPAVSKPAVTVTPQKADTRFDFSDTPTADETKRAELQAALSKRMERIVITDPQVQPDGTIMAKGQTIYLYGINPLNSKQVCTKASKERWACGLHAYADLRNSIAHKTIICDPKSIVSNGVTAVCRFGDTDIAGMLVGHGLAEVPEGVADPDLLKAQASAKTLRLGIWDR